MLTMRSRYALHAMMMIAREPLGSRPVPISRIAREGRIPRKFLEAILNDLRVAGLVESTRGKSGGFRLARPATQISFGEIIRLMEGPLALVPCVSRTAYQGCADCPDEESCAIRRAMMVVRDDTARILDGTSLASVMADQRQAA